LNEDQVINTCGSICSSDLSDNDRDYCSLHPNNSRRCQKCSGLGCCQVPVPIGKVSYKVRLRTLQEPEFQPGLYSVFISEEGWFQQYKSLKPSSPIPAVLAWAIVSNALPLSSDDPHDGNATCP
jgi:hypothetical protein